MWILKDASGKNVTGKYQYGDSGHAQRRAEKVYGGRLFWDNELTEFIGKDKSGKIWYRVIYQETNSMKNPASMQNQLWRKLADFVITLRTANRAQLEDAITGLKQGAADFGLPPTDRAIYKKLLPLLRKELRDFGPKREKYSRLPNPKKNPEIETRELSLYADNLGPSSQGIELEVYDIRKQFLANVKLNNPRVWTKKRLRNLTNHAAHRAARAYSHVFGQGSYDWQSIFNDADLNRTGKYLYDSWLEEAEAKYKPNPKARVYEGKRKAKISRRDGYAVALISTGEFFWRGRGGWAAPPEPYSSYEKANAAVKRIAKDHGNLYSLDDFEIHSVPLSVFKKRGTWTRNPSRKKNLAPGIVGPWLIAAWDVNNVAYYKGPGFKRNRSEAKTYKTESAAQKAGKRVANEFHVQVAVANTATTHKQLQATLKPGKG